ncbi:MAG: cupin domain-containing protein [Paracoccaceae bacterium]
MTADEIIELLKLEPHPEGGFYRQTWAAPAAEGERPAGTCIYFLLREGEESHWHRVDAGEIWHFYAGTPLELRTAPGPDGPVTAVTLGPDLSAGHHPQAIVEPNHWQAARATHGWALVGCTVSPGFTFDAFELAEPDFEIPA